MAEPAELVHPREMFEAEGQDAPETAFLDAVARGRLHHAWLLTGPEGVGKATFAYRAARRLLGAKAAPAFGLLGAAPDDAVSRLILARAHPDLMVLERVGEDGKLRKVIPVDEARRLPEFFAKAPAMGGWRVAIIDAVDDMNQNAANALLKTLEEPPARGVLFLVSHSPGGLLATIRSRCRRLAFPAWKDDDLAAFLRPRTGGTEEDALRLARMAGGAPGRAIALSAAGALGIDQTAHDVVQGLPSADIQALQAIAESFRGAEGAARFELLFERLAAQIRSRAVNAAEQGGGARWAEAWSAVSALPGEVEALNLDRADAFWTAIGALKAVARAA